MQTKQKSTTKVKVLLSVLFACLTVDHLNVYVNCVQIDQAQALQADNRMTAKTQGAILDLLKDVSTFNKKTLESIEKKANATNTNTNTTTNTSQSISQNNKTNTSSNKAKMPEEASHIQLSSKIGQKQGAQSRVQSRATQQQRIQTNLKQKSAAKLGAKAGQKAKAHAKQEVASELEATSEMLPIESQDIQIDESSIQQLERKKKATAKGKAKPQKVQKKAPAKKAPAKKPQPAKGKKKETTESKIVKKAVEEAQSDAVVQGQMSNIATQQQDQLDNIDQVLGAAQLYETQKSGGKYAQGILKSSSKGGKPDQDEIDMMDGDMLEETQTMGDMEDRAPTKQAKSQQIAQKEKAKPIKEKKTTPPKPASLPVKSSSDDEEVHSRPAAKMKKASKPAPVQSKEEMDIDGEQFDQEDPEQLAEDDLGEDFDDEQNDQTKSFVKEKKLPPPPPTSRQPIQQTAQIDEESYLDKFQDAQDYQDQVNVDKMKSSESLKKTNKQLKKDLDQCKLEAGKSHGQVPMQMSNQQGISQMGSDFADQPWQQVAQAATTPAISKPPPEATPSQKIQRIFESKAPAHQKVLEFTKQYCLPELIDSKELRGLYQQFASQQQKDLQEAGARDLIPYVCFYNGLGILSQIQKNPDIKIEPPKDLLLGFKKKRDFILSFKNGYHKNLEQCQNELKQVFQPQQEGQSIPGSGSQQNSLQAVQLDTLLPFQEKYHDNTYLNIYQQFCKKQMKLAQLTQSESKSKVMKPQKLTQSLLQMYTTGLELQQKLDKIMDYDECNEDTALVMGIKEYCVQLFKDQQTFHFWAQHDLRESCQNVQRTATSQQQSSDKCAILNEAIFSRYKQTQMNVLSQVVSTSRAVIDKKRNKELQLRHFVEDAADDEVQTMSQGAQNPNEKSSAENQQQNHTTQQAKEAVADSNSFEHSILSLVKKYSSITPSDQTQQTQQTTNHDNLIEKQQELNLKSCQLFAEQFQDSNNADVATACDYIQQDGSQALVQQKGQSVVTLQDHSQHIFKALRELQQNYVRCQGIPACSQRMDQNQIENFNKIQSLTEDFLQGGLVSDDASTLPQSFLSTPSIAPLQAESDTTFFNRPNSTLEKAAPYIRSLRDDSSEPKKKESNQPPKLEEKDATQSLSSLNQNISEVAVQQKQVEEGASGGNAQQGNLSSLIKDQVSKMFGEFVSRSEKMENDQEKEFEQNQQDQLKQLKLMMDMVKQNQEQVKTQQTIQLEQKQKEIEAQEQAFREQQKEWQQKQEQMALEQKKQQQQWFEQQKALLQTQQQKQLLQSAPSLYQQAQSAQQVAQVEQVVQVQPQPTHKQVQMPQQQLAQQQVKAASVVPQQAQQTPKEIQQGVKTQKVQVGLPSDKAQQKNQIPQVPQMLTQQSSTSQQQQTSSSQNLEDAISSALLANTQTQLKAVVNTQTQASSKAKKHHKKHHKHNSTTKMSADQFIQTAKMNSNNLTTLVAPKVEPVAQKPVVKQEKQEIKKPVQNAVQGTAPEQKKEESKLSLQPQPPKPEKVKKLAQVSAGQSKHDYFKDDPFEKELILEEAALNEEEPPLDETQLMIRSLEQNTQHLQKVANLNNPKLKSEPQRGQMQKQSSTVTSKNQVKQAAHRSNRPLTKPSEQKYGFTANMLRNSKDLSKKDIKSMQAQNQAQTPVKQSLAPAPAKKITNQLPSQSQVKSFAQQTVPMQAFQQVQSQEFQGLQPIQILPDSTLTQQMAQQMQQPSQNGGFPQQQMFMMQMPNPSQQQTLIASPQDQQQQIQLYSLPQGQMAAQYAVLQPSDLASLAQSQQQQYPGSQSTMY